MLNERNLKFDTKDLFNSEELHSYDEDGQKGLLGFLLRHEEWQIINNQIVFTNVTRDKALEQARRYTNEVLEMNLKAKEDALHTIMVVGMMKYEDMLNYEKNKLNQKEKSKDSKKSLER